MANASNGNLVSSTSKDSLVCSAPDSTHDAPSPDGHDRRFLRSAELRERAHRLIPGGAHTYAKGDDQYPVDAPGFIARGAGARVWDVDDNEFIEYGSGLRAVTLGHGFPEVVDAAWRASRDGTNFVRPSPVEIDMAERLLELLPAADMVKFAKNGSDVTSGAVRLARAYTGRDIVAICQDQPFFSTDDWFIGTTPMSSGIPEAVKALTIRFRYNDLADLQNAFSSYGGQIACVFMEAATAAMPSPGYLDAVQALCRAEGALFILDEMITGFRWDIGGAQATYGVSPDLSTFGKGMANGFALSALVGRREIMELGGLRSPRDRVFLLSTTHGAETLGLAAGLATLEIYHQQDVIAHLAATGETLKIEINRVARSLGIDHYFSVVGHPANLTYITRDADGVPSQRYRTLFLQETIRRGLLMPSLVVNFSHRPSEVDSTIAGTAEALEVYRRALEDGIERYLNGRPVKPAIRRDA
jgi:glutamate-1-semialdehyde 2,1-aminomutase